MSPPAVSARTKQPNSRRCFVCGVENPDGFALAFYETGPDRVEADVVIPDKFEGYPGVAHGGIVAALVDEISLRAATAGRPEAFMVTGRLLIRYRKSVPIGVPLRLLGSVRRRGAMTVEAVGQLLMGSEICVEGEAILFESPAAQLSPLALEALGWRVYPDEAEPPARSRTSPVSGQSLPDGSAPTE